MNSIVERVATLMANQPTHESGLIQSQERRIKELEAAERERTALALELTEEVERQEARIKELEETLETSRAAAESYELRLAALRQRIADAPVVAWEYALCSPYGVLDRQASHVNWDERYQPFGRSGVDYATGARVQKRPLISKEDLL